jgi:integrase
MTAAPVPDRWATAMADAQHGLSLNGYTPATIARVLKHATKFGRESGCPDPWTVTPADVVAWLEALTPRPRTYQSSLRTFYRWATRAGRIATDPMTPPRPGPARRQAPAVWLEPLEAYRYWLLASGATWQTIETRAYQITRLALELPNVGPWDVTGSDLITWHARHHWGRESARSNRDALRSFYRWAVKVERIETNPADLLPPVRLPEQTRLPAPEEAYAAALAKAGPREVIMLRLAAELGLRRIEVSAVHRRDLLEGVGGHWLSVKGKGGKLRHLPVPPPLASALLERWAEVGNGYLFPGPAGHLRPRHVGKLCSDLLPPGVTLHGLRHRFATVAYHHARDLFATQQLLGHANPAATRRYVHTDAVSLRDAVNAAARVGSGTLTPVPSFGVLEAS